MITIASVILRNWKLAGIALGALLVVAALGTLYVQRNAARGALSVAEGQIVELIGERDRAEARGTFLRGALDRATAETARLAADMAQLDQRNQALGRAIGDQLAIINDLKIEGGNHDDPAFADRINGVNSALNRLLESASDGIPGGERADGAARSPAAP